jgi:8-oxo-dGTP diphosphatase
MKKLVGGILLRNNKILLGKRTEHRDFYPGVWDIIGGHCEDGESFTDALIRELSDEIGIVPLEYELLTRVDNPPAFLFEIYLIRSWANDVSNRSPDEHSVLGWFTIEEATKVPLADDRYVLLFKSIIARLG